jgi:hypothetical protein
MKRNAPGPTARRLHWRAPAATLFPQIRIVLPPAEQRRHPADDAMHSAHQICSGVAFMIRVIAAVCVSHASVCSRNAVRPAAVRA